MGRTALISTAVGCFILAALNVSLFAVPVQTIAPSDLGSTLLSGLHMHVYLTHFRLGVNTFSAAKAAAQVSSTVKSGIAELKEQTFSLTSLVYGPTLVASVGGTWGAGHLLTVLWYTFLMHAFLLIFNLIAIAFLIVSGLQLLYYWKRGQHKASERMDGRKLRKRTGRFMWFVFSFYVLYFVLVVVAVTLVNEGGFMNLFAGFNPMNIFLPGKTTALPGGGFVLIFLGMIALGVLLYFRKGWKNEKSEAIAKRRHQKDQIRTARAMLEDSDSDSSSGSESEDEERGERRPLTRHRPAYHQPMMYPAPQPYGPQGYGGAHYGPYHG